MRRMHASIALLATCAMLGARPALAQFFVAYAVTPDAPATCDASGAQQVVTGTVTINLPNASNNAFESFSLNGGTPAGQLFTLPGPFPDVQTLSANPIVIPTLSPTPPPYTLVAVAFPAQNGAPVGTGAQVDVTCNLDGSAVLTIVNGIAAPAPVTVPAIGHGLLAALAALLALLGLAPLARRARRR